MSVTAANGFRAAGIAAGIKASGALDFALVVNDGPQRHAAAVLTSNRCQANPVLWSREVIRDGQVAAIALNSGGANCYTGEFGFATTRMTAEAVAGGIGAAADDVLVCSTGLIGVGGQEFRDALLHGVPVAVAALDAGADAGERASEAIMTTDSVPKRAVREAAGGYVIGGMAKGAGMLAPGLATMLVVITTDAALEPPALARALGEACRTTFNRLDSDGCMSTNDQVSLMASGASGVVPDEDEFTELLRELCAELARKLQHDAEGASHDIVITTRGAASEADAEAVGRAIARSNLFKAAVFGNDPNWGRVLAAAGTSDARFDPARIDVTINGVMVCRAATPHEPADSVDLTPRLCELVVDLHEGDHSATILTNDLTHAYVHENSAYAS